MAIVLVPNSTNQFNPTQDDSTALDTLQTIKDLIAPKQPRVFSLECESGLVVGVADDLVEEVEAVGEGICAIPYNQLAVLFPQHANEIAQDFISSFLDPFGDLPEYGKSSVEIQCPEKHRRTLYRHLSNAHGKRILVLPVEVDSYSGDELVYGYAEVPDTELPVLRANLEELKAESFHPEDFQITIRSGRR